MKNKSSLKLATSPFSGCEICSEVFFSLVIHQLANFDALIQRSF